MNNSEQPLSPASSDEAFHLFIDGVDDYAVFMLDAQGRVVTWNQGAARIKGYSESEIIGKHYSVFFPEEDRRAGKADKALKVAAEVGRFTEEGWRVRQDGTRFWANVVMKAIRNRAGDLLGYGKVTRDMTERQLAEENRIKLLKAEEAVRLREEFLSIAAHELRTPLTGLGLYLEGLLRQARRDDPEALPPDRVVARLEAAQGQVARLTKLVEDLLDSDRIRSGRLTLATETIDLVALMQGIITDYVDVLKQAGCTVTIHADQPVEGVWDRTRLEQVLLNLLSNALKYGRGKPITVTIGRRDDNAYVSIADRGPGIPAEEQERIFERFVRLSSARHYGGLGLGLWLTREIVDAMSGSISVTSEVGQGSTFTVQLPLQPSPDAA